MLPSLAVPPSSLTSFTSLSSNGMGPAMSNPPTQSNIPAPVPAIPSAPSSIASGSPHEQSLSLPASLPDQQTILPGQTSGATAPGQDALQQGTKTWSSLDGISRPAGPWDSTASEGILQSAQSNIQPPSRPGSAAPNLNAANLLSTSLDGFPRGNNMGQGSLNGLPNGLPNGFTQALGTNGTFPPRNQQGINNLGGVGQQQPQQPGNGLTLSQQQFLQQQLLLQQQRANGLPQNNMPNGLQNPMGNIQAAAQAAQAAQAARQQQQNAFLRQNSINGQQNLGGGGQPNLNQNALLLQQALLSQNTNGLLSQQNSQNAAAAAALLNAAQNRANAGAQGVNQFGNLTLQQQQQLGLNGARSLSGLGGGGAGGNTGGLNPALANALLNGQLSGNNAALALQALQAQNAQQQLLINQALRAQQQQQQQQGLGGQRPGMQLQSEALIAMQRQQALAQGMRLPQQQQPGAGGGLSNEHLQAMAQLGLLNKPGTAPPPVSANALTPQQQATLLAAIQSGNIQNKAAALAALNIGPNAQQQQAAAAAAMMAQRQHSANLGVNGGPPQGLMQQKSLQQQQQQRPMGLPTGLSFPGQQQPPQQQQQGPQSLLAAALAVQQQANQVKQMPGASTPMPRPPQQQQLPNLGMLANLGRPTADGSAPDPLQTLQDIGRTLAQLSITVEAAVNAGLLGGLSASDVRVVAEAHRVESEAIRKGQGSGGGPSITPPGPASPAGSFGAMQMPRMGGGPQSVLSGGGSRPQSVRGAHSVVSAEDADAILRDLEDDPQPKINEVDEALLKARMEEMAAQFDAGQYGFFGGDVLAQAEHELLGEIEGDGGGSRSASGGDASWSDGAGLADDLGNKLSLHGSIGGTTTGPNSASVGSANGSKSPGKEGMSSLWGDEAQGDKNDPFGNYLAGLRLGTGFL